MRFSPADNAIHVSTYSPNLNQNYPDETPPQNAFDLAYDMGGSGSYTLIGTASNVPAGTAASISWPGLASNTQYEWYAESSDGRTTTTGPTRSFTTQTGGITCYALTLSHTGQGSNPTASPANSTGCAAGQYVSGAAISLSGAVPTAGWQIASWTGTSNDASTGNTNTLSMPAGVRTASVNYTALPNHTVTFNANGGTGSMSNQVANVSTPLTLNTFTRTGFSFNGWNTNAAGTGTPYANGATYLFTADVTLFAQWTAIPPTCYVLTLSHTGQGTDPVASPANSTGCAAGQYLSGATINLSGAVPTTGWQISSWTGTDNDVSTGNTNIVTMPASARTSSVNYTLIPPTCYALTLSHTGQGSDPVASPANSTGCAAGQYISGASISLSGAVPDRRLADRQLDRHG